MTVRDQGERQERVIRVPHGFGGPFGPGGHGGPFGPGGHGGHGGPFGPGGRRGGLLEPSLLLLLVEGPQHGYTLMEALNRRRLLDHEVEFGNLYRTLRRMERDRLVTSTWNTGDPGPNKRVYQIAPAGEEVLKHWAETLESRLRLLNHFLDEYHRRFGPTPTDPPQRPPEDDNI